MRSVHKTAFFASALVALLPTAFVSNATGTVAVDPAVTRITAENAARLIPKGPDAIAGIGDWHLSNGVLCAVISDTPHEGEFSTTGGVLIDLGFCDRADDHYTTSQDLLDGDRARPLDSYLIRHEQTSEQASIIVEAKSSGAIQTTRYSLSSESPTQLKISKRLRPAQQSMQDFNLYASLNFNYHSLEPFVFASQNFNNSNGFKQEDFVSRGTSAMTVAARNADTIITISPPTAEQPIAYGWQLKSAKRLENGESYELPKFVLADDESNAQLILTDTFYIGDNSTLGWLQLAQIPLLTLDHEAELAIEEVIYVGKKGDVASITNQLLEQNPSIETHRISGRASHTDAAIHIDFADGTAFTHLRPNADGSFSALAPRGKYTARLVGSADRQTSKSFELQESDLEIGLLSLPGAASLNLPKGEAMRLVFIGLGDTASPNFIDSYTGSSVTEEDGEHFRQPSSQIFLAGLPSDLEAVQLAAGAYRVYATRGPEYSLESTEIEVSADKQYSLEISIPQHLVPTPGYIASDLHVHSGQDFDNTFSETERVRTFVAEHGEVMVSSGHDKPVDFAPLIREMGADHAITSIAGAEVTSLLATQLNPYTAGHTNFFPYHPQPFAYRRGMVNNENRRLRDIIYDVKQISKNALVQLNHPRQSDRLSGEILPENYDDLINSGDYFEHMGTAGQPYSAHRTLQSSPNNVLLEEDQQTGVRDLDFDLIEVINPGGPDHESRLRAVRSDWMSLLKQGELKVATANSDSHDSTQQVAVPRNMVAVKNDSVLSFNQPEFLAALKAGNSYGTTGPMLDVSLSGKLMGETYRGAQARLKLKIRSAKWIPISKAIVQVNGETIQELDLADRSENDLLVPLRFNKDSFVTVEVSGPTTQAYRDVYPGLSPYAFTNPIYVDYDSDGNWQAPGL